MLTGEIAKTWLVALLTALVAMAAFAGLDRCVFEAAAHDRLHPGYDDWYGSLRNPHSTNSAIAHIGCCSKQDCHETEAEMRGNDWWARLGDPHHVESGIDWEPADWVKVPPEAVLQNQTNPTGSAVICHEVDLMGCGVGCNRISPKSRVWCFVPPTES